VRTISDDQYASYEGAEAAVNTILELAPESWDDDAAGCSIAEDFVKHLVTEVARLGGCLHSHCRWLEHEACDHGYYTEVQPPPSKTREARLTPSNLSPEERPY
jgi:hypothetical protein